jgi:hypothetical protein
MRPRGRAAGGRHVPWHKRSKPHAAPDAAPAAANAGNVRSTFYKPDGRVYVVTPCRSNVPECVPVSESSAIVTWPFTSTKR